MRANMIPNYNMYQYQTPEPGTPYTPWSYNYSSTNSDSTSPETPEEREIRLVFGVQNYHQNSQNPNAKTNNKPNQMIYNQNFMNNSQMPISNPSNMAMNSNPIQSNETFMNSGVNHAIPTEINAEAEAEDEDEDNTPFSNYEDKDLVETEYNFLTDPCCCCPVNWQIDGDDEIFTMG